MSTLLSFWNVRSASSSPWRRSSVNRFADALPGMAHPVLVPQRLYWIALVGATTLESSLADESNGWMYWYRTLDQPEVSVLKRVAARDDADELVAVRVAVLPLDIFGELDGPELAGLRRRELSGGGSGFHGRRVRLGQRDDECADADSDDQRKPDVDRDEALAVRRAPGPVGA